MKPDADNAVRLAASWLAKAKVSNNEDRAWRLMGLAWAGTEKAATIKTHHNRVAGIQRLLQDKRIVEPLSSFYKYEVREIRR